MPRVNTNGYPIMKPGQAHTLDTIHARCIEVGDCWEWQGTRSHSAPVLRSQRKIWPVRRYIAEVLLGKETTGKLANVSCGNLNCVAPDHVRLYTRQQLQQQTAKRTQYGADPVRKARISKAKSLASRHPDELVAAVIAMEGTSKGIARALGLNYSTVNEWRNHGVRGNSTASPWAGLGSRT